jgi:uncharacterized membrane protein
VESKAKLLGHPVHPILIVFPLGLLVASLGFDVAYLIFGDHSFNVVAFWMIVAGVIGGLLAAIFGAIDWWAIPPKTRAKSVGSWHGGGNVLVVILFIINWYLRMSTPGYVPSTAAITLSCFAVGLALITGWLGGELVDRLGVGIDNGAHLNATNSLSGRPAAEAPGRQNRPSKP